MWLATVFDVALKRFKDVLSSNTYVKFNTHIKSIKVLITFKEKESNILNNDFCHGCNSVFYEWFCIDLLDVHVATVVQ